MNIQCIVPVTLTAILFLSSCKKDKDEEMQLGEKYELQYDGGTYIIDAGKIWTYNTNRYPSHNSNAHFLLDGSSFSQGGNYNLDSDDPPISIFYFLSIPKTQNTFDGVFEFHQLAENWFQTGLPENLGDKKLFTDAYVGFDSNGDKEIASAEVIKITGGIIRVYGIVHEYDVTLSNGKTLKGSIKATLTTEMPPA